MLKSQDNNVEFFITIHFRLLLSTVTHPFDHYTFDRLLIAQAEAEQMRFILPIHLLRDLLLYNKTDRCLEGSGICPKMGSTTPASRSAVRFCSPATPFLQNGTSVSKYSASASEH
jgi:hypothetical protein